MTYAKYAPRVNVHPDRYGSTKTLGPNLWAVLHSSEGGESTSAAEGLASYMTRPGDRPNGSGGVYGSSYQVVFDTDQVIPCVPYDVVSYSAGGANAQGVHGCFPGRAGQTRAQWLDPVSRAMIRQAAAWLLDVEVSLLIPTTRITAVQMRAGQRGYCDHATVTLAFGKTDHTDVGPNFPWDVLLADIAELRQPAPTPTPTPTGKQTDMIILNLNPGTDWWVSMQLAGDELTHLVNGNHVAVMVRGGVPQVSLGTPTTSGEVELAGVLQSVGTTNASPFAATRPDGSANPSFNQKLHDAWVAAAV